MSALDQFTNSDGLVQRYGVESEVNSRPRATRAKVEQELVIDFLYSEITADSSTGFYDADASGGSTPDSFSSAVPFIPADSCITAAYLIATTAWTGTATLDIGFENQAGTAVDADGLYNGLDVDSATVGLDNIGCTPIPNGVLVQNTSGTYDPDGLADATSENLYVRVINADAGTLTAGAARLVVKYISP